MRRNSIEICFPVSIIGRRAQVVNGRAMIAVRLEQYMAVGADDICAAIFDVQNWTSFQGYGPLPGIARVVCSSTHEDRLGNRFEVENTDGSRHTETVIDYIPGQLIRMQLDGFSLPLNRLAMHFVETWRFSPNGNGTIVEREFQLYPKNRFGHVCLILIAVFLKRAVARHLRVMATALHENSPR